jgi:D-3-phosphoglycerate dehydrogenase
MPDAWIVGHSSVTRALLEALPGLQIISRRGVGFERVDIDAARDLGRVVTIAAGGNDASVADHTIGLMLAVTRRFKESQLNMQSGDWSILIGSDLFRKTVGIIGLGRIGKSVVKRLQGFDVRILADSPRQEPAYAQQHGIEYVSRTELLERSDYVLLHAPLSGETRFTIDAAAIDRMKPTAVLINTARGGLVEDSHLLRALQRKRLAGAGLDVFVSESDPSYQAVTDALLSLPNVVATPHAGASSREALDRSNMLASIAVVAVLNGEDPAMDSIVADGRKRQHPDGGPA